MAEENVFIRIDRDDPHVWEEKLANLRFLEDEGMSGSAQFSEMQFRDLAERLRERAEEVRKNRGKSAAVFFVNIS